MNILKSKREEEKKPHSNATQDRMNTMSNVTKSTKAELYELNLNASFES
jgi:hypothetical protein